MTGEKQAPKFVFSTKPSTVLWPCLIAVPQDGGTYENQSITVRFTIIPAGELEKLMDEKGVRAGIDKVIVGFEGFNDETGQPVPTDTAKALLLQLNYCVMGFLEGYREMVSGRLLKN